MEIQQKLLCLSVIFLSSCTNWSILNNYAPPISLTKQAEVGSLINKELADIGKPFIKPTIAVYPTSFPVTIARGACVIAVENDA